MRFAVWRCLRDALRSAARTSSIRLHTTQTALVRKIHRQASEDGRAVWICGEDGFWMVAEDGIPRGV